MKKFFYIYGVYMFCCRIGRIADLLNRNLQAKYRKEYGMSVGEAIKTGNFPIPKNEGMSIDEEVEAPKAMAKIGF